jgi:hypothetical protein
MITHILSSKGLPMLVGSYVKYSASVLNKIQSNVLSNWTDK